MTARCVLDTDVLIGVLDDRDAHHRNAARLVMGMIDREVRLHMNVVNYAEALVRPSENAETLRVTEDAIAALCIAIVSLTIALCCDAALLRRSSSLAGGFALATARQLDASVATFDDRVLRALKPAGLEAARLRG